MINHYLLEFAIKDIDLQSNISEIVLIILCEITQLVKFTIYRRHKNLLTKARATHEQYYRTLLETSLGNSKKIWSNINCILGKKHSSINTTIKLDGIHVAEPETIANQFNSYFNSIPITLSDNINNNLTAFESFLDDQIPESTIFIKPRDNENHNFFKK